MRTVSLLALLAARNGFLLFLGASLETGTVWISELEKEGDPLPPDLGAWPSTAITRDHRLR